MGVHEGELDEDTFEVTAKAHEAQLETFVAEVL